MGKLGLIVKETFALIRRNRWYFLAPVFLALATLAFLVFTLGPTAMITFLYAGI